MKRQQFDQPQLEIPPTKDKETFNDRLNVFRQDVGTYKEIHELETCKKNFSKLNFKCYDIIIPRMFKHSKMSTRTDIYTKQQLIQIINKYQEASKSIGI